jgi:hypothetical protein
VRQLPLRSDEESEPGPRAAPNNPFLADLRPRARATTITHCGQQLAVAPPILSHAACFSFFAKVERDPAVIGLTALQEGEPGPARDDVGRANSNPLLLRSEDHDKDLTRLFACADPRRSLGLKPLFHAGDFEGAWEGRFCFFDFDSYREMLAGRMRSLYEGPFGEQPQVWKVREHIVRVGNGGSMQEGGTGSILNAGYVNGAEEPDQLGDGAYVSPEKVAAARDEAASGSNVEGLRDDKGKKSLNAAVYEGWAKDGRPRDWHLYPSFGDDEEQEASDDPERYEILLSGTVRRLPRLCQCRADLPPGPLGVGPLRAARQGAQLGRHDDHDEGVPSRRPRPLALPRLRRRWRPARRALARHIHARRHERVRGVSARRACAGVDCADAAAPGASCCPGETHRDRSLSSSASIHDSIALFPLAFSSHLAVQSTEPPICSTA